MMKSTTMWTELYKPETIRDLVGNEGAVNQLFEWLKDWDDVHIRGHKKEIKTRFSKNWMDIPRINAKAALLSGPPGVGKTSACRIICKHLGYQILEFNASDTRNKSAIHSMIGTLSGNQSLDYWTESAQKARKEMETSKLLQAHGGMATQKCVIVMDEVDGCGASDRGGIAELIQVIKASKTPIICICNDRTTQKLKSLITYCYDLKFMTPTPDSVVKRLRSIADNEKLEINDETLRHLVASSGGGDIRQIINILQMWRNQDLSQSGLVAKIKKDEINMINNFDAAHKLLNCGERPLDDRFPTLRQKLDLFFIDYDMIPLLI